MQDGSIQALDIMCDPVPTEISAQLSQALEVIERHLASTISAAYLYGSAMDGGLKPSSDIDVLVAVASRPEAATRQALIRDLLEVSAPPGQSGFLRALEVTVLVRDAIVPWRYPAMRELQFGEWLRKDILDDIFEPAVVDPDLAILLMQVRQRSMALVGPPAESFFDPVPGRDLRRALSDTLALWNSPADWSGDERNVVLTLARIWYSAVTGRIVPKVIAADWAIERLAAQHQSVLFEARQAYLGHCKDRPGSHADEMTAFVHFVKGEIATLLANDV